MSARPPHSASAHSASDSPVDVAWRFLRGHTRADIRFEEHLRPIRYVIAPDGRLVAPVMVAMLRSVDTVLFIPETMEGAMEVQVTLAEMDEHGPDGALADRWRIHHGEPEDVRWAMMSIDAARCAGNVVDGEVLMRPNPLAEAEPRLCMRMNQEHRDGLRALCRHVAGVGVEQPVMVAIDPMGIDVRGRFDVIRIEAERSMTSEEEAMAVLQTMIQQAQEQAQEQEQEQDRNDAARPT